MADEVRDELLLVDEIAKVELRGAQEERVFIEYDNARLSELGISPGQFQQILEGRNIIISGGSVRVTAEDSDERIVLEPSGNFESVEDIARTVISVPGQVDVLYLEDLATVRRAYVDPPVSLARCNGDPSIVLAISMRAGGNILDLGQAVKSLKRRLEGVYPHGIDFDLVVVQSDRVEVKVAEFSGNLLQAILIVFVVMLIFLGPRTGLVVATLVPGAILMSLMLFAPAGVGIDQMSLAALIIALGMLVDNAIVMSESVLVQMSEGKQAVEAAVSSSAELRIPLLTSTLTTAAAFLPIFLAKSSTGEYTGSIFIVVTLTLLCSWILALTMIPMLCVLFLKVKPKQTAESFGGFLYRAYRNVLILALKLRWLTLALTVAAFFLSLQGFRYIPQLFFPPSDRTIFTAELKLPPGTAIERTAAAVEEIEAFMERELCAQTPESSSTAREGVTTWATFIGEGAPRFILTYNPTGREAGSAFMVGNVSDLAVLDQVIARLEGFCSERFPGMEATVSKLDYGPPIKWPVEVRVSGRDSGIAFAYAEELKQKLRDTPGVKLVTDDWGMRTKKLLVHIDQERAYRAAVSNYDIALSLQTLLSGLEITQYREGDDVIPVVLRSHDTWREQVDRLESLNVYAQATGNSVPLSSVADLEVVWEPSVVMRRDRLRTIKVQAELEQGVTAAEVNAATVPWLEQESAAWQLGYRWELGGEAETSGKGNASIAAELPLAAFLIMLLLVSQFNSLRKTAIILLTIPLGIIGVVIGLLVTGSYFGFMTLLGIVSLSGIVINNAIVLIDRIRIEIEDNGLDPARGVVEAAQRRLRPILLTTFTTAGGLVPLWLGGGLMFQPMAIAILFGLLFATLLTLGFVPVLYSLFFRVSFRGFRY